MKSLKRCGSFAMSYLFNSRVNTSYLSWLQSGSEKYNPVFKPDFFKELIKGVSTSRFAGVCLVTVIAPGCLLSQRATPSWCLEVMTAYLAPAPFIRSTHCCGS